MAVRRGEDLENPWKHLPEQSPFLLQPDLSYIEEFNQRAGDDYRIVLDLLPEPFLGNPDAPIMLLSLNPGFSPADYRLLNNPYGRDISLRNLLHEPLDYPFFLLDPGISWASGAGWWRGRLGAPIRSSSLKAVAQKICCVEFFPYHSKKYKPLGTILESQRYSFSIVEHAVERGALIIAMRSAGLWSKQVPKLIGYDNFHACTNYQRPYVSRGNLPLIYSEVERILLE